ncbi:hypothetical protein Avbf_01381 [Armadillidium vulgare]|nr:hypothetical protein Avbf_01381 [Armadillidium vulgare]
MFGAPSVQRSSLTAKYLESKGNNERKHSGTDVAIDNNTLKAAVCDVTFVSPTNYVYDVSKRGRYPSFKPNTKEKSWNISSVETSLEESEFSISSEDVVENGMKDFYRNDQLNFITSLNIKNVAIESKAKQQINNNYNQNRIGSISNQVISNNSLPGNSCDQVSSSNSLIEKSCNQISSSDSFIGHSSNQGSSSNSLIQNSCNQVSSSNSLIQNSCNQVSSSDFIGNSSNQISCSNNFNGNVANQNFSSNSLGKVYLQQAFNNKTPKFRHSVANFAKELLDMGNGSSGEPVSLPIGYEVPTILPNQSFVKNMIGEFNRKSRSEDSLCKLGKEQIEIKQDLLKSVIKPNDSVLYQRDEGICNQANVDERADKTGVENQLDSPQRLPYFTPILSNFSEVNDVMAPTFSPPKSSENLIHCEEGVNDNESDSESEYTTLDSVTTKSTCEYLNQESETDGFTTEYVNSDSETEGYDTSGYMNHDSETEGNVSEYQTQESENETNGNGNLSQETDTDVPLTPDTCKNISIQDKEKSETKNSSSNCEKIKNKIRRRQPAKYSSQNGELELERTIVSKPKQEKEKTEFSKQLVALKKEIQAKNNEIKELKVKLKQEREKIKDIMQQAQKGQKIRPGQELISTKELRHLRKELSLLREGRHSLRQQLLKTKDEEKAKDLLLRKLRMEEERKKKKEEGKMKREEAMEARRVAALQQSLEKQQKGFVAKFNTLLGIFGAKYNIVESIVCFLAPYMLALNYGF